MIRSPASLDASRTAARRPPPIRRATFALACTAVLLATLTVLAAPAHAHVKVRGNNCAGSDVVKCLWLHVDHHNRRVRGYASVRDVDGGPDYWVQVTNIVIQKRYGNGTTTILAGGANYDEDGWFHPRDEGATGLANCLSSENVDFRVLAQMRWFRFGTDDIISNQYHSDYVSDNECFTG